jgi:hypothetical protein
MVQVWPIFVFQFRWMGLDRFRVLTWWIVDMCSAEAARVSSGGAVAAAGVHGLVVP